MLLTEIRLWKISLLYSQTGFRMHEENSDPLKCCYMCCHSIVKVVTDLIFERCVLPCPGNECDAGVR